MANSRLIKALASSLSYSDRADLISAVRATNPEKTPCIDFDNFIAPGATNEDILKMFTGVVMKDIALSKASNEATKTDILTVASSIATGDPFVASSRPALARLTKQDAVPIAAAIIKRSAIDPRFADELASVPGAKDFILNYATLTAEEMETMAPLIGGFFRDLGDWATKKVLGPEYGKQPKPTPTPGVSSGLVSSTTTPSATTGVKQPDPIRDILLPSVSSAGATVLSSATQVQAEAAKAQLEAIKAQMKERKDGMVTAARDFGRLNWASCVMNSGDQVADVLAAVDPKAATLDEFLATLLSSFSTVKDSANISSVAAMSKAVRAAMSKGMPTSTLAALFGDPVDSLKEYEMAGDAVDYEMVGDPAPGTTMTGADGAEYLYVPE